MWAGDSGTALQKYFVVWATLWLLMIECGGNFVHIMGHIIVCWILNLWLILNEFLKLAIGIRNTKCLVVRYKEAG